MDQETPKEVEVTPAMIEAGASVLFDLAGEASPERLAKTVFLAMIAVSPYCLLQDDNSESKVAD